MSALEIFANHLSRLSFDNSRVLSPWCSITLGSLKKDLLSLPCLFEQFTIAQKAGMIISAYQSIKSHSGKSFVYTSGLLVCLPIWRTINWWRHTRTRSFKSTENCRNRRCVCIYFIQILTIFLFSKNINMKDNSFDVQTISCYIFFIAPKI